MAKNGMDEMPVNKKGGGKVEQEEQVFNATEHDPGRAGFHKLELGGVEDPNWVNNDAYVKKDEGAGREEKTDAHALCLHQVVSHGNLYSGDPSVHGAMAKEKSEESEY